MTSEESLQCDLQHQAYMQRREEFNKKLQNFLEDFKPKHQPQS